MSALNKIESGIDRLIGIFSPRLEYARRGARKLLDEKRAEQYAAAKTTRPGGDWNPLNTTVNDVIRGSAPTVRARVRQLTRDFPYFAKAVKAIVDHTVGDGILLQSRMVDGEGKLKQNLNQKIEDTFKYWADDCDVGGRLNFYEMMQVAKRQDIENGEFVLVKTVPRVRSYLPYQLQMFEGDWLESDTTRWVSEAVGADNAVDQGVEYQPSTGRVLAYHFTDPDGWGKSIRVPVNNVVHNFDTLRPGQLRGISPFTTGVVVAKDLSSYLDSEIDGAKLAAKYLAFVKSMDPAARQLGLDTDDEGKKIDTIESAIVEYLQPGEDITIASHDRPGSNFEAFTKLVLQMVSVSTGCPYEILTSDYQGLNYNTIRASRNDTILALRPIVRRHIRHYCMPVIEPFFNFSVMMEKFVLPNYFVDPKRYWMQVVWQPPGMEPVDPLRESKARIEEVKAGLRSPQEICAARGRDYEQVLREISEWKEAANDLDLGPMVDELLGKKISTANANNPAAVDPDTSEETNDQGDQGDQGDRAARRPKVIRGGNMRKKKKRITRDANNDKLNYRKIALPASSSGSAPATLDDESRSVEVVGLTEEPAEVFDWERGEIIKEILRMDGAELPRNRQVPLLDSHNKFDTSAVIGSFRDLAVGKNGRTPVLSGRVYFSTAPEAEGPFTKVREGHLTDFSGGYRPITSVWVPANQKQTVMGRSYTGPVMVRTRWRIKELSVVAIGADELAKARGENHNTYGGSKKMDPRLREYLEKMGLSRHATEDQAWQFFAELNERAGADPDDGQAQNAGQDPPAGQAQPAGQDPAAGQDPDQGRQVVDVNEIVRREQEKERDRLREIEGMRKQFDLPQAMVDNMVNNNMPLDACRKAVLDWQVAQSAVKGGIGYRGPLQIAEDERDKWRGAALDGMLMRAGHSVEDPRPGANDTQGFTLMELARHSLRVANQPIGGHVMEMIGRAFTSSDFPLILQDVANKSLFAGFDTAEETWSDWCGDGSVSDFKIHNLPRLSEADDLDEIPEHGEYKYGKFTEANEQYSIATYGKLFAVTRQTIINDDLQAMSAIPSAHGEAAARKIGDVAYAVLTGNAAMGDGVALFDAAHGNYVGPGSGAPPGAAAWAAAILAMGTQKDLQGKRRLNINPVFLIAPKALQGSTEVFFTSEFYHDEGTLGTPDEAVSTSRRNPYFRSAVNRIYESRLDDVDPAAWYAAGPRGKTVTVFFLNGVRRPYLETRDGWKVDGVEYKVRMDAGAKAVDWRALYFNDGN